MKIYTGSTTGDQLLYEVVAPFVSQARRDQTISHWFFVRYSDPDSHLRIRFFGEKKQLWGRIGGPIHEMNESLLKSGRAWKIQMDTYEREIERYGGPNGMLLSEQLFCADSDTCLELIEATAGDEYQDTRWRLAIAAMDGLLGGFGLSVEEKKLLLTRISPGSPRPAQVEHMLSQRFRNERKTLELLLSGKVSHDGPLRMGFEILRRNSMRLRTIAGDLLAAQKKGDLASPIAEILPAYLHMCVNR